MTEAPPAWLAGTEVLVVDDEELNRRLLATFLRREGCPGVRVAASGEEALALVDERRPDLILLDLLMPGIGGLEVLRHLVPDGKADPDLPIVVLTADATESARHRAFDAGATDYLTKPIDLREVGLRMANLLEAQRMHRLLRADVSALRSDLASTLSVQLRERSALVGQLVEAQERERTRIARDLHDSTIQQLIALALELDAAAEAGVGQPDHLAAMAAQVRATCLEVRSLVMDLRPPVLDDIGLLAALRDLVADHEDVGAEAHLPEALHLPAARATELYRIVQASLANARAHAACTSVRVEVAEEGGSLAVRIADDGVGFTPPSVGDLVVDGHLGLAILEERARHLGAHLEVDSAPGRGTEIRLRMPVATSADGWGEDRTW